jgi:1-acyl-sn-glycerol-3-phosphate acyltransferase
MKTPFLYFCRFIGVPLANLFIKKIDGKENIPKKDSFIVASNHINSLDIWFIGNIFRERMADLCFLAAMDSFRILLMSGFLYYLGDAVVINRKKEKRGDILKKVIKKLKEKKFIVFFPEGDTNRRKELLRGKTGMTDFALKKGVPIIPLGMGATKGSCKRLIKVGKPLYLLKERRLAKKIENNKEEYNLLLRKTTDKIMQEISKLSKKPYLYDN